MFLSYFKAIVAHTVSAFIFAVETSLSFLIFLLVKLRCYLHPNAMFIYNSLLLPKETRGFHDSCSSPSSLPFLAAHAAKC